MAKTDRYRVKPGSKVKLATHDPADQSERSKAGKGADAERLAKLGARLNELQDVLYAESKHRILLVLQGMDTSGKDGTIRHVFSTVDPLGVRVTSFKVPTAEELAHDYLWRVHSQVPAGGEIVVLSFSARGG